MEERVGRGSSLGGRAVVLHLAESTLSGMESEAVSSSPAHQLCWIASSRYLSRHWCHRQDGIWPRQQPAACLSPGVHGPLG